MHTLLLVSAAPATYQRLTTQLDRLTFRITCAEDTPAVECALARTRPAIILVDLDLPAGAGWHLSAFLRCDRRSRRSPQLALTGQTSADECSAAFAAGFSAYLRQPLDIPNLLLQLDQALEPTRLRRPLRARLGDRPAAIRAAASDDVRHQAA